MKRRRDNDGVVQAPPIDSRARSVNARVKEPLCYTQRQPTPRGGLETDLPFIALLTDLPPPPTGFFVNFFDLINVSGFGFLSFHVTLRPFFFFSTFTPKNCARNPVNIAPASNGPMKNATNASLFCRKHRENSSGGKHTWCCNSTNSHVTSCMKLTVKFAILHDRDW